LIITLTQLIIFLTSFDFNLLFNVSLVSSKLIASNFGIDVYIFFTFYIKEDYSAAGDNINLIYFVDEIISINNSIIRGDWDILLKKGI